MKKIIGTPRNALKIEYSQKGYVVLRHFFSENEVNNLNNWAQEIIDWPIVTGKWLKYFERLENDTTILSRIENFVLYHPELKQIIQHPDLIKLLSMLMGEPVIFFKEKLNLKPPHAKGYTPHQDAPAFFDIDYDAITLFTVLDPSTIESGCLYFVKNGSHYVEYMLKQNEHNHALSEETIKNIDWEPIECNPYPAVNS
jgi:ectoine hydroxylase-related dioxygenase (phytanoyl-CoA dioxygenase family)